MSLPKNEAWFAAKRYGYGWGLPRRWQGWVVFFVYMAALLVPSFLLAPRYGAAFLVYLGLLTLAFGAMCVWKGEPARWRWGDEPDEGEKP